MATTSPPPNSTPGSVSPAASTSPPPPSTTTAPPPATTAALPPATIAAPPLATSMNSPSSQTNATSPSTSSPPPVSTAPPPSMPSAPPPKTSLEATPPKASPPPPPIDPPSTSNPPPPPSQSPPPPVSSPTPSARPRTSSPPPASSIPPTSSPPPSSTPPPQSSSPPSPPLSTPLPQSSPPPSLPPPLQPSSAPPPQSSPPTTSSSPPPANSSPPQSLPTPPSASNPPTSSPPPPASVPPPENSPPPPLATAPQPSPPPSNATPPPKLTPPSSQPPPPTSNHTSKTSPPPLIRLSPPPPSIISPSSAPPSVNNTTPSSSRGAIGTGGVVAIGVVVVIIMLSLIGLIAWCLRKRRKDASGINVGHVMPSPLGSPLTSDSTFSKMQSTAPLIRSGSSSDTVSTPTERGGLGNSRSWFTYEELVEATNGFSSHNLLGEGGFGSVYKGYLPDGREIAVKQLKIGGEQGEREFKAEVETISRIHHRHLVSLVGYCISEHRRLLVYEFVPNDTLHFHLHGEGRPVLDWATRVKIATGAARGIAYLHEDCHPRIIHRDIKSSNILLDTNFEAKVSDFGLAKLALDANTHVTTRVMGTFGYMAPEYASSGKLTEKSDVFSYGVVLLELITGRKPVDASQPLGDESLVEWARPFLSYALDNEEFDGLVDPRLEKNYDETEMFRVIEAAAACVRHSAAKRPRMGQIVRAFDSLGTADLTNGMRVGESEVYNSAEQSAEIRLFRRMAFGSQNYSTDFFSQGSLGSRDYTAGREQYHSSINPPVSQIEMEP